MVLPLSGSVAVTNGLDAFTWTGPALTPLNCVVGATIMVNGVGYFIKERVNTTNGKFTRNYAEVDDAAQPAEIQQLSPDQVATATLNTRAADLFAELELMDPNWDQHVPDMAGRAAYNDEWLSESGRPFAVLVSNTGDGRAAIYSKASMASGDWVAPAYLGTEGPAGNTGPAAITWRGAYAGGTVYAINDGVRFNGTSFRKLIASAAGNAPSSAAPPVDTAHWEVVAAKGLDGDMSGPASAVAGRVAAFDGATGKLLADGGKLVADLVSGPASSVDNRIAVFDGLTGELLKDGGVSLDGLATSPNLLSNPNFALNQRGYVSGAAPLMPGARTLDRWSTYSSGQVVTFNEAPVRTVTIPAGTSLYQVVEGFKNEGGSHVLSWEGTATAEVRIGLTWVAAAKGTPFVLTAAEIVVVRFLTGTVNKPKLEKGIAATRFINPEYSLNLIDCQQYYQTVRTFVLFTAVAGAYVYVTVVLATTMRGSPTVTSVALSPDTNFTGPIIDEIYNGGCRLYGQATNSGSVGVWRRVVFDTEWTV